jgi:PTS system cellobiose-specific IIC component
MMEKIQAWIQARLVPVVNKITSHFWFGIIANAVLFIVPFSMASAVSSLWGVLRKFFPALIDLSPIGSFSFGLSGLFMVFLIAHDTMVKVKRRDRSLIAGFTAIGTYMLCMNPVTVDQGSAFTFTQFGAAGLFTAMFLGVMVGMIFKSMANFSFFKEDSVIPDFVKNWFDNIFAIVLSLLAGFILTHLININVFTMITIIMSPVTYFAQSIWGVIFLSLVMDAFYFFGVSGWVWTPITMTIQKAAIAENTALVAAGSAAKNIYAYGFSRYQHIGGEGTTLPIAIYMLRAKSKKYRILGKATLVPSLFNINEPLFYGMVVNNPFMFIPVVLVSIINSANTYIWMKLGWAQIPYVNFDMNNLPNVVSAWVQSGGCIGNVLLVCVNACIAAVIYYPFFKAADNYEYNKEQKALAEKQAAEAEKNAQAAIA